MIMAIKKQKETQMFSAAVVLLTIALALLWLLPSTLFNLVILVIMFFTAFNYLEATMPSILSRLAPAGVKGSVMGIYSSSQFMGAFCGGLIGGTIATAYDEHMIFLAMAAISVLWFVASLGLKPLKKSKSYSFKTTIESEAQAENVAEQLINMPGVIEAILVHNEAVAYLKIDDKVANVDDIKSLLRPSYSK